MAEYMDKQTAVSLLDNLVGMVEDTQENDYDAAIRMGVEALKAEVQPVVHGRWEIYQLAELGQAWTVQCSVCHAIGFHGKTPYCCECGARMDSEQGGTQ